MKNTRYCGFRFVFMIRFEGVCMASLVKALKVSFFISTNFYLLTFHLTHELLCIYVYGDFDYPFQKPFNTTGEKKCIQIRLRVIVSKAMEIVFKSEIKPYLQYVCLCGEIDQRYVTKDIFWEYPYLNIIRLGIKF